jgi:hypothetical protein
MTRSLGTLHRRIDGVSRNAPGHRRPVRLIWYDPKSDPENPTVCYDSAAEDPFFTDEK